MFSRRQSAVLFVPAGYHMSVASVGQGRAFLRALFRRVAAAGAERAAARHVQRAGHISLQDDPVAFLRHPGIRVGNRA